MSDEPPAKVALSQEQLDMMQNEIAALLQAWEDRGIPVPDGVQVLMANAHLFALTIDASLGEVVQLLVAQWEHSGGRI